MSDTTVPKPRQRLPTEVRLRLLFAALLLLAAWGTSPNPWGYIQDAGAYSQALFIVGFVQLFEAFIALARTRGP